MLANDMPPSERRWPQMAEAQARPSPLLVLKSGGESVASRFFARFEHGSRHRIMGVAVEPSGPSARAHRPADRHAWLRCLDQFPPVCVGLVAQGDVGLEAAAHILTTPDLAQQPGACVLLGFDRAFIAWRLALAAEPGRTAAAGSPLLMVLSPGDPHLGACAAACRALQRAGAQVNLAVMPDDCPGHGGDAASDLLVGEIDRFFDNHLAPGFPWRF